MKGDKQKTVLITTSSFGAESSSALDILKQAGFDAVSNPFGRTLSEVELGELLSEHRPIAILAGTEDISRTVIKRAKDYLRVISRVGTGWENVDRAAAEEAGIRVYRTQGILTEAVAELTIGMMLSALRYIAEQDRKVRQGRWEKQMGGLLQGKVVGLIGFGSIGQRVGELVRAFDAKVIYYDPEPYSVPWAEPVSLSELLIRSDILSLHASGKGLILGREQFDVLGKQGVIFINTARGGLVDEAALYDCLHDGRIGYACLDVYEKEPYNGPLCGLDNVILTPHIGSYAREARQAMETAAVENVLTGLKKSRT